MTIKPDLGKPNSEDYHNPIGRGEFELFSNNLNSKMDEINIKTSKHEEHINSLNSKVNDIKNSVEFLEKSIDGGFTAIDKRLTDISNFQSQQADSLKDYNIESNERRDQQLVEQLSRTEGAIANFMNSNTDKIQYTVDKIDKFEGMFDKKDDKKKAFWTNIITAIVSVIIALINILPSILGR